jgi:NAD(P)-dependent dehydrogenase (short-subunit alcohol dehydrogenase family)
MLLEGRNVLVFAATGAIGSAVARRVATEGATVWVSGRDKDALQSLVDDITASGGVAHAERVDATCAGEIDAFVDRVVAEAGSIDAVFNGIGGRPRDLGYPARVSEQSLEDFLAPVQHIVGSQFLTARAAARPMADAGSGSIVLVSTGLSSAAAPLMAGISAASIAVEGMTRSLAAEFGPHGIRVNCVRGSAMPETRTIQETGAALASLGATPMMPTPLLGRPLTVAETAATVAFLASDMASGMTGQIVAT